MIDKKRPFIWVMVVAFHFQVSQAFMSNAFFFLSSSLGNGWSIWRSEVCMTSMAG